MAAARPGLLDVDFPLGFFDSDLEAAARAYAVYADDQVDDGWTPSANDEQMLALVEEISNLLRLVADAHGVSAAEMCSGSKSAEHMAAKREFAHRGKEEGFSQVQLAKALRCSPSTLSYLLRPNPNIRSTT